MHHQSAKVIVLRRINYGEADRIITVLSKESGKLLLMAKGVRKSTSKLAGGIELFSESDIQYIKGKNNIHTLVSTRMSKHFGGIMKSLALSNAAYELLSAAEKVSEHSDELDYYNLLRNSLGSLDDNVSTNLVLGQFYVRLLKMTGHTIDISQDINGDKFEASKQYQYNFESGGFEPVNYGYSSDVVKLIKLMSLVKIEALEKITGAEQELENANKLLRRMAEYYINIKPIGNNKNIS